MGALVQIAAPSLEPITVAEAKKHTRVDFDADDTYIASLIKVSREAVEETTSRRLIDQTYEWFLDDWPIRNFLRIPLLPVKAVSAITVTDEEDLVTPFTDFLVDLKSEPARIVRKRGELWPLPTLALKEVNAIKISLSVGYGAAGVDVPVGIIQAIKLMVGHLYENREATIPASVLLKEMPLGIRSLLMPFSNWNSFASSPISQEDAI